MKPLNPPQGFPPKHPHCPHPALAPGALFQAIATVRSLLHRALYLWCSRWCSLSLAPEPACRQRLSVWSTAAATLPIQFPATSPPPSTTTLPRHSFAAHGATVASTQDMPVPACSSARLSAASAAAP